MSATPSSSASAKGKNEKRQEKDKDKQNEDKVKFDTIVKQYLDEIKKKGESGSESSKESVVVPEPELEVRFGTMKHSTPLSKDNVTNIIKKLKSSQFKQETEEYSLRVFLNDSDVRVQLDGFSNIQNLRPTFVRLITPTSILECLCKPNEKSEKTSANKSFPTGKRPVKILGTFDEPPLRIPIIP
jgi:hypothetical protein